MSIDVNFSWLMRQGDFSDTLKKLGWFSWLVLVTMHLGWIGDSAIAQSQIVIDNTLENENSQITPNQNINGLPSELIEGGARRDNNLFHSFSQFNVEAGRGAYFANPNGIANIFSRVTGANASEIMGTLGVNGNANLFLINPNGIIFGEDASLDLNGSFISTTADAIQFGEQGFFNASEPNAAPLLTVQPSALFFNQMNSGRIETRAIAPAGFDFLDLPLSGLRVGDGASLIFAGRKIAVDGGGLYALNGQIELLSIGDTGKLEFDLEANKPSLIPPQLTLADISLENGASLETSGAGGGEIRLQGKNITIADESIIFADVGGDSDGRGIFITAENLRLDNNSLVTTDVFGSGQGGNIVIKTKSLNISNASGLLSRSFDRGDGGNISLDAELLNLSSGSSITTTTLDRGNSGDINLNAREITLDSSAILSEIDIDAVGDGGNISLNAESLSLAGGSRISSSIFGQGNSGDITLKAREIALDSSAIFSEIDIDAIGDGGNISFDAESLSLTGGSGIFGSIFGQGNSGDITLNAESLSLAGESSIVTNSFGQGDGGDINIVAESFSAIEGALLNTDTSGIIGDGGNITITASDVVFDGGFAKSRVGGRGDAGNIIITTGSLLVTGIPPEVADSNTGQLVTATFGQGNAGSLIIEASGEVIFDGRGSDVFSLIGGNLENPDIPPAEGNAGNIEIDAASLSVTNKARLVTNVEGIGNGGNIKIDTDSLSITNEGQLLAEVATTGIGDAGDINIVADSFDITNRGRVSAGTAGVGEAGNIEVAVDKLLVQSGGQIVAQTSSENRAGNLTVLASESIALTGEGEPRSDPITGLFVNSLNETASGNGGNLEIITPELEISDGAVLTAVSQGTGDGGNIKLSALETLTLRSNSSISTTAGSAGTGGNGGNIEIETDFLIAFPDENTDIIANAFNGNGGEISLQAQNIFNIEERQATENNTTNDIDASSEFGLSGIVEIEVSNVDLSGENVQPVSLPTNTQVVRVCDPEDALEENSFFVSRRNSLQDFTETAFPGNLGWEDWQIGFSTAPSSVSPSSPDAATLPSSMQSNSLPATNQTPEIVEAQNWIINDVGKVELVAKTTASSKFWSKASPCRQDTQAREGLYE